jgi:hypothetical protein
VIDLGLNHSSVITEAKVVRAESWAHAVREAIVQLYEYWYFQVVSPAISHHLSAIGAGLRASAQRE